MRQIIRQTWRSLRFSPLYDSYSHATTFFGIPYAMILARSFWHILLHPFVFTVEWNRNGSGNRTFKRVPPWFLSWRNRMTFIKEGNLSKPPRSLACRDTLLTTKATLLTEVSKMAARNDAFVKPCFEFLRKKSSYPLISEGRRICQLNLLTLGKFPRLILVGFGSHRLCRWLPHTLGMNRLKLSGNAPARSAARMITAANFKWFFSGAHRS